MNIFVLDKDPIIAASYYCDKHVVKMPTEIAQMLCNAFEPNFKPIFKRTHYNHPISKWVRSSMQNYLWTIAHGLEVCKEYTKRYGKIHKSQRVIEWCRNNMGKISFSFNSFIEHPICVSEQCDRSDPVTAYRDFYIKDKAYFAKWKLGNIPFWFKILI
jgi:hypothetical protein